VPEFFFLPILMKIFNYFFIYKYSRESSEVPEFNRTDLNTNNIILAVTQAYPGGTSPNFIHSNEEIS